MLEQIEPVLQAMQNAQDHDVLVFDHIQNIVHAARHQPDPSVRSATFWRQIRTGGQGVQHFDKLVFIKFGLNEAELNGAFG